MKKILQISMLLLTHCLWAQSLKVNPHETYVPKHNYFMSSSFQVEKTCFVDLEHARPNSKVNFYSHLNGGKFIKGHIVDENGALNTQFEASEMPSFVLNEPRTKHEKNRVQYFDEKEFVVKDITLKKEQNGLQLIFDAIADSKQSVSYTVSAVDPSGVENVLHEVYPFESWEHHSFHFDFLPKMNYKLSFYNQGELRYTQSLYLSDLSEAYIVYPTLVNDYVNIDFLAEFKQGLYHIVNVNGQLIAQGELKSQFNRIELSNLDKGVFLVYVQLNGEELKGAKFIKQ